MEALRLDPDQRPEPSLEDYRTENRQLKQLVLILHGRLRKNDRIGLPKKMQSVIQDIMRDVAEGN